MNPRLGLIRLHQPRSSMISTLLLATTFLAFALIVSMVSSPQHHEITDQPSLQITPGTTAAPTLNPLSDSPAPDYHG